LGLTESGLYTSSSGNGINIIRRKAIFMVIILREGALKIDFPLENTIKEKKVL
jgi:hypothetical protein